MPNKTIKKGIIAFAFSILLTYNEAGLFLNASKDSFDFSRKDSLDTITVSSADLIEKITGEQVMDEEREFLNSSDVVFKYEGKISTSNVSTSLINQELIVHAEPYTYVDVNDNTILWVPFEAKINDNVEAFVLDEEKYKCVFNDNFTEKDSVEITYKTVYSLDYRKVNELINKAYKLADSYVKNDIINQEKERYELEYKQYLQKIEAYNKYQKDVASYNEKLEKYEQYLAEKQKYDEKYDKYLQYLADLEEYNKEVEKYEQYLIDVEQYDEKVIKYQNYLLEKEKYDVAYQKYLAEYEKYAPKKEKVDYQLAAMDLIKTSMTSLERDVYSAVMGGTVTEVLARRDELVQLNADAKVIDEAEAATYALRSIFSEYFVLQAEKEKYVYYKANYTKIKSNIEKLLRALEKLYRSGLVSTAIEMFEKTDKYLILVAQLAVVANALDDKDVYNYEGNKNPSNKNSEIFNSKWKIEGKTIMQILENDVDFVDVNGNAYPLIEGYPTAPIAPTPLEVVDEPKYPTEVAKPIAPVEVLEPENNLVVVEKPTKPAYVSYPKEPQPFEVEKSILDLIDAYNDNKLKKRDEFTEDVKLTMFSSFSKKIVNEAEISIEFYDTNGEFIDKYVTEYGSYILYNNIVPIKEADEVYSKYAFSHWEYQDGEKLDLNNVVREGFVYPVFKGVELQKYEVKWIVDGKEYNELLEYGSIPKFKGETDKKVGQNHYYEFVGWDNEIVGITNNVTYTAVYEEKNLIEYNGKMVSLVSDNMTYQIDCNELENIYLYIENFFDHAVEKNNTKALIFSGKDFLIELSSATVSSIKNNTNVAYIEININKINDYEYYYFVNFYNSDKEEINNDYSFKAKVYGTFDYKSNILYAINQDEETPVRASISNNNISFEMQNNVVYHTYTSHAVKISTPETVKLTVSTNVAKFNEIVTFEVEKLTEGFNIDIYIMDSLGNKVELDNNSFVMPNKDVYVIVSCEYINYTVEFKVDGETISSTIHKFGDTVDVPSNPIKASDEEYTYTFVGWDKEITTVSGDVTYNAVFEKNKIEKPDQPTEKPVSIIKTLKIVGACVAGGLVLLIVLLVLRKKKVVYKKK